MAALDDVFLFIGSALSWLGASHTAGYAITLAIEEIFTNLVKYNPGADGLITISLEKRGPMAEVAVHCPEVQPFDLTQATLTDTSLPLESRTPGGLGILLTREMVDELRYSHADQRSTITFTKKLEP